MSAVMQAGKCRNVMQCEKAKAGEIQQAPKSRFKCSECGGTLISVKDRATGSGPWIAAGVIVVALVGGGAYGLKDLILDGGGPECEETALREFMDAGPAIEGVVEAGIACVNAAAGARDREKLGMAAQLFRQAGDAGSAEGAFRLAELYDPAELDPEPKVGMPYDSRIAYDNYRLALRLGKEDARARLADLKRVVTEHAEAGDFDAALLLERWQEMAP